MDEEEGTPPSSEPRWSRQHQHVTTRVPLANQPAANELDRIVGAVIFQVGDMISARFAAIEERLLPEQHFRPSHGGKKREVSGLTQFAPSDMILRSRWGLAKTSPSSASSGKSRSRVRPTRTSLLAGKLPAKGGANPPKKEASGKKPGAKAMPPPPSTPAISSGGEWTEVTRKKQRKAVNKAAARQRLQRKGDGPPLKAGPQKPDSAAANKTRKLKTRIRPPKRRR